MKKKHYKIIIRTDAVDNDLKWIVCQHCKKPVYGMRTIKDAFLPTEKIITKWIAKKEVK